ncbi:helix-turn-helix domain-containing protein [Roseobacter fucihabitans]
MSGRELNRVEVLAQVDHGRLSADTAANMLDLTRRQIFRLSKRYRQDGAAAIRHKSRGCAPNNQFHAAKRGSRTHQRDAGLTTSKAEGSHEL